MESSTTKSAVTSPEAVVRRLLEEGFSQGRAGVVDQLVADDMVEHQARGPGHPAGPAGVKAVIASLRRAFPDFRLAVQDLAVAGEVVWTRNLATGTHEGPFQNRQPTGRRISIAVYDVMRVRDGRIVEHWGLPDHLALLAQIGEDPAGVGTRHAGERPTGTP
jgi:predicted ester cyclase